MSLLDGKKKEPVNQMDIAADASKDASKDAPKAAAGEKPVAEKQLSSAAAYQRRKKEKIRQGAKRILANKELIAKMDATDVAFIKWLDSEPGTASLGGGGSVFAKLFGNSPKVGDKITLQDAFDRTFKGKGQMDGVMKKLKEKNGIEIEFVFNKEKPALSTYEIKSLGTPAAEKETAEKATA